MRYDGNRQKHCCLLFEALWWENICENINKMSARICFGVFQTFSLHRKDLWRWRRETSSGFMRCSCCHGFRSTSQGERLSSPRFQKYTLREKQAVLTCVSALRTLILWVEMNRSTSVRVWASPSALWNKTRQKHTKWSKSFPAWP